MRPTIPLLLTLSIALAPWTPAAAGHEYRQLDLPDGSKLDYAVVLPHDFDAARAYPVLLALPPGSQDRAMVEAGLARYWGEQAAGLGWVVVSPVAPNGVKFFEGSETVIPALLDAIESTFEIEGGKLHLAGSSNGGRSAFRVALDSPERFRTLLALPGFADDEQLESLANLRGITVRLYVGGNDGERWLAGASSTKRRLDELGFGASLEVYPGEGHVPPSLDDGKLMVILDKLHRRIASKTRKRTER